MKDKDGGFDWILALILFLAAKDHREHERALEEQRALIKPFWWESGK